MNTNTSTHRLFWLSEDKQSSLEGGDFESLEAAMAASQAWLPELLRQCGDAEQRESIRVGSFSVEVIED